MRKSEKTGQLHFGNLWKNILFLNLILLAVGAVMLTGVTFALKFTPMPEDFLSISGIAIIVLSGFVSGKIYCKYKKENPLLIFAAGTVIFLFLLFLASATIYGEIPSYVNAFKNFLILFLSLVGSCFIKNTKSKKRKKKKR